MTDVFVVQPHEIGAWASRLYPHLERFEKETGRTDAVTILQQAARGTRQLWGVREGYEVIGVLVTEVYPTARGDVCWIWAAAGTESEPGDILRAYHAIEGWARKIGCTRIGINGRKGWLKVLPGFELTSYVMEKAL